MRRIISLLTVAAALTAGCENTDEVQVLRAQAGQLDSRIKQDQDALKGKAAAIQNLDSLRKKVDAFLGSNPVTQTVDILFPLQTLVGTAKVESAEEPDGTSFSFTSKFSPADAAKAMEKISLVMPWLSVSTLKFEPQLWTGKLKAPSAVIRGPPKTDEPRKSKPEAPKSIDFPDESRFTKTALRRSLHDRISSQTDELARLDIEVAALDKLNREIARLNQLLSLRSTFDGIVQAAAIVRGVNDALAATPDPWEIDFTSERVNLEGKQVPDSVENRVVTVLGAFGAVTDYGKGAGLDIVLKPNGME